MSLFCVPDHSKYFLKNLLRGWEKLSLSQIPPPMCGPFPKLVLKASLTWVTVIVLNFGF